MRIVDRADGTVLFEVSSGEGEKLTDLVEDVQSFQISELFLEVALREGVDENVVRSLRDHLASLSALSVGLEPIVDADSVVRLAGQTLDHASIGIGGLVVTAQSESGDAISWSYSRPDGRFELSFAAKPEWSKIDLLVSGRGGLLLSSYELDELDGAVDRLEPFFVLTATGRIVLEDGTPLAGGRLEAWSSWSKLDDDGVFRLPLDRLSEDLHLEVFSETGEPLGGYWSVTLPASEPVNFGEHRVPAPTSSWPDSDQPLMALEFPVEPIFAVDHRGDSDLA